MPVEKICNPEVCTACMACRAACPKTAISKGLNELGEEVPIIDPQKCISCGICVSTCPSNKKIELKRAGSCYAAWSKSEEDMKKSSSGGIAAIFSRNVISEGGVVYGASSRDSNVFHERIDSIEKIDLIRGSKYVKSDINNCYTDIREQLSKGKRVLFIGTPCQVAGIKSFLGGDQEKLLTVDLICHGTPPFEYLKEYLDVKCNRGENSRGWDTVSFRINGFVMRVFNKENVVYQKEADQDLYYSAFLQGLIFRKNCYRCPYARPERVGDLTIGDFWGLDRGKIEPGYKGKVSLILPNSQKGLSLLQACRNDMALTKLPLKDAINPLQGNLIHPSIPHKDREDFENLYVKYGFFKALKRTGFGKDFLRKERVGRIKRSVPFRVVRRLYYLLKRNRRKE